MYIIDPTDPYHRRPKRVPRKSARPDDVITIDFETVPDPSEPSVRRRKRVPKPKHNGPYEPEYVYVIDHSDPSGNSVILVPLSKATPDQMVDVEFFDVPDQEDPTGLRMKLIPRKRCADPPLEYVYIIDPNDPLRSASKKVPRRNARHEDVIEVEYYTLPDPSDATGRRKRKVPRKSGSGPPPDYVYVIDPSYPSGNSVTLFPWRKARPDQRVGVDYYPIQDPSDRTGMRRKYVPRRRWSPTPNGWFFISDPLDPTGDTPLLVPDTDISPYIVIEVEFVVFDDPSEPTGN